jgi:hypothetical protein
MFAILLPLGVLCAAAGLLLAGFGVPYKEFALGGTLMIAGATVFTGGLIVIALSAAVRQLNSIANALGPRPQARPVRKGETAEASIQANARTASVQSVQGRTSYTPNYSSRPASDPADAETRALTATQAAPSFAAEPSFEEVAASRPPANIFGAPRGEATDDETEVVPLSPQAPSRMPMPSIVRRSASEPRFAPEVAPRTYGNAAAVARSAPRPEPDIQAREPAERTEERPPRSNPFDVVWPARRNSRPQADDGASAPAGQSTPAAARGAPAAQPVSILKSGVIDGMAYTLFTDGSIEAQLPQGTMRFASIEGLRAYLEQHP